LSSKLERAVTAIQNSRCSPTAFNSSAARSALEEAIDGADLPSTQNLDDSDELKLREPGFMVIATNDDHGFKTMRQIEKEYIVILMDQFRGNKHKVARTMGFSGKTLYNKLYEYELDHIYITR
jgi:DNA-binding NtrC family response regulator